MNPAPRECLSCGGGMSHLKASRRKDGTTVERYHCRHCNRRDELIDGELVSKAADGNEGFWLDDLREVEKRAAKRSGLNIYGRPIVIENTFNKPTKEEDAS